MLEKTMRSVINKKIKEWISTVDDKEVQKVIEKDLIITGGCFTSMIQNEQPKDFDCYFRSKESVLKVAEYYAKKWNGADKGLHVMVLDGANPSDEIKQYYGVEELRNSAAVMIYNCAPERVKMIVPSSGYTGDPIDVRCTEELGVTEEDIYTDIVTELDDIAIEEVIGKEKKPYFPVFISSNAITLSNGIQIVVRFYGEPRDIHDTYDFAHTKAYYDYGKRMLDIPKDVYEHVINKTLKYTGSKYPVCSVFRVRKFIERGWTINAGQLLKMCMQISELDLMNINVLEDQLIGVDSLYFMALIDQFRMQQKDKNFELTSNYVVSIIDKIF